MKCHLTATARKWRCSCELLWHKCRKHILKTLMRQQDNAKGYTFSNRKGVKKVNKAKLQLKNNAHPKRRGKKKTEPMQSMSPASRPRTFLIAGSKLARRFPAVYARQVNDDRMFAG